MVVEWLACVCGPKWWCRTFRPNRRGKSGVCINIVLQKVVAKSGSTRLSLGILVIKSNANSRWLPPVVKATVRIFSSRIDLTQSPSSILLAEPQILYFPPLTLWTAVTQWLRCCATNRKVAGSIPVGVTGFFIDIKSFRPHYGPGVDSASNRNEYQEHFLGLKAAGA